MRLGPAALSRQRRDPRSVTAPPLNDRGEEMTGNEPEGGTTKRAASSLSRRGFLQAGGGLVAAGAGAALLGSCSSSGGKTSGSSGTTGGGGKTTLKLMSWEQFEEGEKVAWNKVISDFEAANPNISVSWTGWPFATFDQNVIAQAQAGSVDADVVMCPPELATALITKFGACVPLQSITDDLKLTPIPAHEQFKNGSDLEGLGVIDVPFAITYDQKLLREAGVAPPTSIDEWTSAAQKLTHKPDQFGMNLLNSVADGADWWNQLQNFPLAYDGAWAKGKTLQFTSEPVINSMKLWMQLLDASGPKGSSEAAITKLWESDRIAMNLNVAAGLNSLKTLAPKLFPNLRSTPPPWPSKKAIARLHPVVVLKDSKNQQAAMELVKFMITPKNLYDVTIANGYPIIPFSNFGDYEPKYATYLKTTPWMSGYLATNYVGEFDILGDYTVVYAQIGQIITRAMANAVSGGSSVEDAMAAAQKQAQQELSGQI
jgi:multiple sugar transport system substrate-binding protein